MRRHPEDRPRLGDRVRLAAAALGSRARTRAKDDRHALVLPAVAPGTQMLLGRSRAADVRFLDPTVSRRHVTLTCVSGGWTLLDLRSTHGTFVNGRRVEKAVLHDGDTLTLGRARPLVVRL